MRATTLTIETARTILNFDFIELWIDIGGEISCFLTQTSPSCPFKINSNNNFYCERTVLGKSLSVQLCEDAKRSNINISWLDDNPLDISFDSFSAEDASDHRMLTKMAVRMPKVSILSDDEINAQIDDIYLVGGSFRRIPLNSCFSRYLFSISDTINVSLFCIDKFDIRTNCLKHDNSSNIIFPSISVDKSMTKCDYKNNRSKSSAKTTQSEETSSDSPHVVLEREKSLLSLLSCIEADDEKKTDHLYPIKNIPIKSDCDDNFDLYQIRNLHQFAEGMNSKVYIGMLDDERVVVKMTTANEEDYDDDIVNLEYDTEFDILSRIDHPGIIQIIAKGNIPRKFLVLEWLGGGTLENIFQYNTKAKISSSVMGFSKHNHYNHSFTFSKAISYAYDLASTLSYLHSKCHPGATIIHRDLKPDNIAFTYDGKLKLLDFGLCACVKTRRVSSDTYEMTGNTGSLRYMAPEVILCRPYTEKADVYSFGILVWQMVTQELPYSDITSRASIVSRVALGNERPKISSKWPTSFKKLLEASWHDEYEQRPSFDSICIELRKLSEEKVLSSSSSISSLPQIKLPSLKRSVFGNR